MVISDNTTNIVFKAVFFLFCAFFGQSCDAQNENVEQFVVVSEPSADIARPLYILLVPGSGLNTREYIFDSPYRENKATLFTELSGFLTTAGYRVIRYDEPTTIAPSQTYDEVKSSRLAEVIEFAQNENKYDGACLFVITVSEGLFTIADAISASKKVEPLSAIIGISAPLQSKSDIVRWQMTRRLRHNLLLIDLDADGQISERELLNNWQSTALGDSPVPEFLIKGGYVDLASVDQSTQRLEMMFSRNQMTSDKLSLFQQDAQRVKILESWIKDREDPVEKLNSMKTPIALLYGLGDGQMLVADQIRQSKHLKELVGEPVMVSQAGHALGKHQLYGPMLHESHIEVLQLVRRLEKTIPACASGSN